MSTCGACGGSGRVTQVNSDGLSEFGGICPACGGHGKFGPDEIKGYPSKTPEPDDLRQRHKLSPVQTMSLEAGIINTLSLVIWIAISYYGIAVIQMEWYWPVGAGFLVSLGINKLLTDPLYGLIRFIANLLAVAFLIAIAVFLYNFFD